jgi:hypothetical protein
MEVTTKRKAHWILWKYGLSKMSFDELSEKYLDGVTEEKTKEYLFQEDVQQAIKRLLKIMHQEKMIRLYETYYDKAIKGDVNSAKFLMDFSKELFSDKKDEILSVLSNLEVDDDE